MHGKILFYYHVYYLCQSNNEIELILNANSLFITRSIISAISPNTGETDEGEYATLKNTVGGSTQNKIHFSEYDEVINIKTAQNNGNDCYDNTSEEGKLLACVHSETVTYASTRIIEPPKINPCSTKIYDSYMGSKLGNSVLAPVAVQVEHQVIFFY